MDASQDTGASAPRAARTRTLALAGCAAGLAVVLAALGGVGVEEPGWQAATRLSARVSALLFLAAFCAGPLARLHLTELTGWLSRERRGIGLAFCAAHTVHLAAIAGYARDGGSLEPAALLGGALAYGLLYAMAATSSEAGRARLGARRWNLLHATGMYYLWAVFALAYLGRVVQQPVHAEHAALFMLMLFAMLLRLYAALCASPPGEDP